MRGGDISFKVFRRFNIFSGLYFVFSSDDPEAAAAGGGATETAGGEGGGAGEGPEGGSRYCLLPDVQQYIKYTSARSSVLWRVVNAQYTEDAVRKVIM